MSPISMDSIGPNALPPQTPFTMSPLSPSLPVYQAIGRHQPGLLHTASSGAHSAEDTAGNGTEHGHAEEGERVHHLGWYLPRIANGIILAVILLLTVYHLTTLLRHRHTLKRRLKARRNRHQTVADPDTPPHRTSSDSSRERDGEEGETDSDTLINSPVVIAQENRYRIRAWNALQRNWLYLSTFPAWLYGPETVMDAIWTVLYCLGLTVLACWNGSWDRRLYVANQMGILAYSQVPIIIILIQKNNPISSLTGITYQKLNYLHRASSRACLLLSWCHGLLWTPEVWKAGHFRRGYLIAGLFALFGFTMLWITSFRVVRRILFEFFLITHILFTLVFVIGGILHWNRQAYWLWPSLLIWWGDKALRKIWLVRINPPTPSNSSKWFRRAQEPAQNGECTIRILAHDVMLVTARRPGLTWAAGQHFYLHAPSVSSMPHETHPFSIANMPNERDEAVFLIRVHNGFTRRLRDRLSADVTTDIPIYLDGPYGTSHSLDSYSTILLIAGGTGVTFLSSHLLALLQPTTPQIPRHIHLIWHIRYQEDITWLAPMLNEAASLLPRHPLTRLTLDIHVTKSHRSDEPAPMAGLTEMLVDEYAPRRFSRRFSRNMPKFEAISEMPSAVGSDDEAENAIDEEEEEDENEDDEQTPIVSGGRSDLQPKRPVRPMDIRSKGLGLSVDAAKLIFWNKGRADLRVALTEDLETTDGDVMVTVCGPVQLLHGARRAVRDVDNPTRALRGQAKVDFYEETLGS